MLAQPVPQKSPREESRLFRDRSATALTARQTKPQLPVFRKEPT